ncbi:hypothetical protein F5884DRAFT_775309 [Xylogone sp. PMI_703]|nr:hypothetical protein F5884DRAFT_775309 [Xylogone sp. PMI_703]
MDVCDKVSTEDSGGKDAVASMIKRLAHRNANVQLYTLELANALSQNCGIRIHRELASRAFTDALLRLANDRNTHQQVKAKVLERMEGWAEMFKDPDLGIMRDQYNRLKSQNPNLHPPSAPQKSRLTDLDRQREEEDLQMALKLSIQEKNAQTQAKASSSSEAPKAQAAPQSQAVTSGTTAATVSRVRALFDFHATDADELEFRKGDIIAVIESVYKDWWKGLLRGKTGIFPLNYVEKLPDPTPEELQREAQMEAEVFAEIKNVEKLLTLLSTSSSDLNVRDNEEITQLYHSTLAIRPKLIELIGKYSQKKDEFTQLNERFIKSCRDYESLLDASMTQQPAYGYGRPGPSVPGYGGGYPPQAAAPPPQDPQRYYSPGPQEPPYPPQTASPAGYPPRNGPQPFYVVAGGQQPDHTYPPQDHTPRIPSSSKPAPIQTSSPPPNQYGTVPQTGHRPQSTYSNPQELATSVYDSPVNNQPNAPYSASVYSDDPYSATAPPNAPPNEPPAPPAQQQYTPYSPPQKPQQAPNHPASIVPQPLSISHPAYPSINNDARQSLPSQSGQYKPYRPAGGEGRPGAPSVPSGTHEDFYRQNAAY